jgi:hypothetical protein
MSSWVNNPKIQLRLASNDEEYKQIFVGLYINDTRLTLGAEYFKDALYCNPLAFDIVPLSDVERIASERSLINEGSRSRKQPPYMFGTTQIEVRLKTNTDYVVVPSLYKRTQSGVYYLDVSCEVDFNLGSLQASSPSDQKGSQIGTVPTALSSVDKSREKEEQLRERLASEAARLGVGLEAMSAMLGEAGLSKAALKRRLMDSGFNVTDFPDEDLAVLDRDNSGAITPSEFLAFFKLGLQLGDKTSMPMPPVPVDDLLFQSANLEGVVSVSVVRAKNLALAAVPQSDATAGLLRYDHNYIAPASTLVASRKASVASSTQPQRMPSTRRMGSMENLMSPRSITEPTSLSSSDQELIAKVHTQASALSGELKRSLLLLQLKSGRGAEKVLPKDESSLLKMRVKRGRRSVCDITKDAAVSKFLAYKSILLGINNNKSSDYGIESDLWDEVLTQGTSTCVSALVYFVDSQFTCLLS